MNKYMNEFLEKYSREEIESVQSFGGYMSMFVKRGYVDGFNINESYSVFNEYLTGYAEYISNEEDLYDVDVLEEKGRNFIYEKLFNEENVHYVELPSFIESYMYILENIDSKVDNVIKELMDNDADQRYVGQVSKYNDIYMERLSTKFYSLMDSALKASGYKTKQFFDNYCNDEDRVSLI